MNPNLLFMISLIGAVLKEDKLPEEPQCVDWNEIFVVSQKHNVANIIAYAISLGKYELAPELHNCFLKALSDSIAMDVRHGEAFKQLFKSFDENSINYMPLKGLSIKKLYFHSYMRCMCDGDVLIREEQYEHIKEVMKDNGYEFKIESNHEYVFVKPPYICVELHKYLVPSYNDDFYEYYGNGWKFATKIDNSNRYELSKEDEFVYLFTHTAKHYRDSGIGIRHIVDLWLYMKTIDLNMNYVEKQLNQLSLYKFYVKISTMIKCWFEGETWDKTSENITLFMFRGGSFGDVKNRFFAETIRNYMDEDIGKASKYRYLKMVFPDFRYMLSIYPSLEKKPYLLLYYWIKRIVVGFLFKRGNISYHLNKANSIYGENISMYQKHMNEVGLDIYNGRKKQ